MFPLPELANDFMAEYLGYCLSVVENTTSSTQFRKPPLEQFSTADAVTFDDERALWRYSVRE